MPEVRPLALADRSEFLPLRLLSLTEHPECYATTAETLRTAPLEKTDALLSPGANSDSKIFGVKTTFFTGDYYLRGYGFLKICW